MLVWYLHVYVYVLYCCACACACADFFPLSNKPSLKREKSGSSFSHAKEKQKKREISWGVLLLYPFLSVVFSSFSRCRGL